VNRCYPVPLDQGVPGDEPEGGGDKGLIAEGLHHTRVNACDHGVVPEIPAQEKNGNSEEHGIENDLDGIELWDDPF